MDVSMMFSISLTLCLSRALQQQSLHNNQIHACVIFYVEGDRTVGLFFFFF